MTGHKVTSKDQLLHTVSQMLDGAQPHSILVDDVLEKSGISRGSLYHHFGDFPALIEAALIQRFSATVDENIAVMNDVIETAVDKEDYWSRMDQLTVISQDPKRARNRAERARIIGLAASNERFRAALSVEQERMTSAIAGIISIAQDKGWVTNKVNSRVIAVFLQAYSLGRAVDDIAQTHISSKEWEALIHMVTAGLADE